MDMEGLAFEFRSTCIVRLRRAVLKGRWSDITSADGLILATERIDGRRREPHAVASAIVQQWQRFSCPG